ncbi:MAG: FkbM family methyltransferase [Reyranella sp.]|nr:FkbM family methyltransferase [Reyranella sp.]
MAKYFFDVGGYQGESSRAALDPLFGFTRVYCFEPVVSCREYIEKQVHHSRFELVAAGLFDRSISLPLYGSGSLGASIYSDAPSEGDEIEQCQFIRASDFFREHVSNGDSVWMKLNCEGAEIAVLNDLLDSGEASKLTEVLIDFDAAKIPSMRQTVEALEERLVTAPFSYHYPPEVQFQMTNNYGGIRNWLLMSNAAETGVLGRLRSMFYQLRYLLDSRFNGYYKIRVLRWLGLRPPAELVPVAQRSSWSRLTQPRGPLE